MGEWWTYSLQDFLLFSPRTYYRLFELHNRAVWPAQVPAMALGLAALALSLRGGVRQGRATAAILAASWLWVAWAYLLERYDTINWLAKYLAAAFTAEALLLAWAALRGRLTVRPDAGRVRRAGLGVLAFALVLQPLTGPLAGRLWAQVELFGVTPDPTVVATLGVLLTADRTRWELLVLPLAWCAVSGATAWAMGSPDAPLMPAAALATLALAGWKALSRSR
jgi:hypothetical protein